MFALPAEPLPPADPFPPPPEPPDPAPEVSVPPPPPPARVTDEPVIEEAFRLIKKVSELIDMSNHKGENPRFGATVVCPLVPIAQKTMEKTVDYSHKLGKTLSDELGLSGNFYENDANSKERKKRKSR